MSKCSNILTRTMMRLVNRQHHRNELVAWWLGSWVQRPPPVPASLALVQHMFSHQGPGFPLKNNICSIFPMVPQRECDAPVVYGSMGDSGDLSKDVVSGPGYSCRLFVHVCMWCE